MLRATGLPAAAGATIAYCVTHPRRVAPSRVKRLERLYAQCIEPVDFRSRDGLQLSGSFLAAPERPLGILVLVHGMCAERSQFLPWIPWLLDAGFSLLLFDLRGCGISEGARCTIGLDEKLDLLGAIDYLISRGDCGAVPIGVLGYSFGGVVAIQGAALDERIQFVVSQGAYSGLGDAVDDRCHRHFGSLGPLVAPYALKFGQRWAPGYERIADPESVVGAISPRPILIINGAHDPVVPTIHAQKLYQAAGEPKSLLVLPDTGHEYPGPGAVNIYRDAVLNFIKCAVAGSS